MDWAGPEFVIALIAITTGGWLVNNWIRARHGYALEDEWGGKTDRTDSKRLEMQNAQLRAEVGAIKERLITVERIVTDSGFQLTRDIASLDQTNLRQNTPQGNIQ